MKLIVAVDEQWGIGRDNDLLFSIPEDMKFFRETTTGKVVVMGRRTLQSLPNAAPLKNRVNIVLTRDGFNKIDGAVTCNSIDRLANILLEYNDADIFVIGGHSVYEQLLDYCDEAYVTKIKKVGDADCFFPNLDINNSWVLEEVSETKSYDDMEYCFCRYKNKAPSAIPGR